MLKVFRSEANSITFPLCIFSFVIMSGFIVIYWAARGLYVLLFPLR